MTQKLLLLIFFNLNSSRPITLKNKDTGVIRIKKIKPKIIGLIIFPIVKPNSIQPLFKGVKRELLSIVIERKIIKSKAVILDKIMY